MNEKVKTRISERHRREIEAYVAYLQEELRVEDWIIHLSDDEPEGENESDKPTAQISTRPTNRYAVLRIGDRFFNTDDVPDEIRTTVLCHELVHLHLDALSHLMWELIDKHMHPSTRNEFQTIANNTEERAVDQLAWAFAKQVDRFHLPTDAEE